MVSIELLPRRFELSDFSGNYTAYIDALYKVFHQDFVVNRAHFGSHTLRLKFNPLFQDRAYTFYHMTHKGEKEDERIPDLRRCENLVWAKPSIENVVPWKLKFWRQLRKNSRNRVCIMLEVENEPEYFIILEVRDAYVLLWTAFVAEHSFQVNDKLREYQQWKSGEGKNINTPDELVNLIQNQIKARSGL